MPYGGVGPLNPGADPGQDLPLTTTNATQFASAKCGLGVIFSAPLANTAAVYIARATSMTTSTGIELQPGDSTPLLPAADVAEYFARTGTSTQHVHALAI